tara:strand:+ start:114 stop:407 length:294 start_codon:yes stop_codon:yes gene_type:complete
VPEQNEVSHADIYHKLGSLEAKLDAAIASITDYKTTSQPMLNEAFGRIRKLEDKMVWTIGAVAGLSLILPLIFHTVGNNFHIDLKSKGEIAPMEKIR